MNGVKYDGNMDRGAMTFTSDVSLPKDSKQLCEVNKLQLGNGQNYERTAMLIMLLESKEAQSYGHYAKTSRPFIHQHLLTNHPP